MRITSTCSCCAGLVFGVSLGAHAQDFPVKPIRVVIPAGAGGSSDVLARLIGEKMRERLGPTVAEAGVPGYEAGQWWGYLAPAKVPGAIVAKLNSEINTILSADDMRTRLEHEGAEPVLMTPEAFTKFVTSEIEKFRKVVKEKNLKAG